MKLINTDGMAFIGPGSEWFWAALSGIVTMVTLLAIWRQLRLQASTNAREQMDAFNREWGSERMLRHRLDVLLFLRDGTKARADLHTNSGVEIANFWERVGALGRSRHLDTTLLWKSHGDEAAVWWAGLSPAIEKYRADNGSPSINEHFEWLAFAMTALTRRSGNPTAYDEEWLPARVEQRIAFALEALRFEQALRTVIVASPEFAAVAQPPAPAVAES